MTIGYNDDVGNQLIRCPNCKAVITVEELHEYVNSKPDSKIEAIEHEIEIWGLTSYYNRQYYAENVVICPFCVGISHLSDWRGVSSS